MDYTLVLETQYLDNRLTSTRLVLVSLAEPGTDRPFDTGSRAQGGSLATLSITLVALTPARISGKFLRAV
jgi:hypothetical protein